MKKIIGKITNGPKGLNNCVLKVDKKIEQKGIKFFDGLNNFFDTVICDCQTIATLSSSTITLSNGFVKRLGGTKFSSNSIKNLKFIVPDNAHNPLIHSINVVEITKFGHIKPIDIFAPSLKETFNFSQQQ